MGYLLPTTTWTLAAQCSLRYWHCSGLLTIYWQVYISAWSRACMQGALPEQDTIVTTAANADLLTKTCLVVCWCKQGLKCKKRLPGLFGDVSPHFFFRGLHRLPKIFNPKPLKASTSDKADLIPNFVQITAIWYKQWIKIYDYIGLYCFSLEAGLHTVVEEYETQDSKYNTKRQPWCQSSVLNYFVGRRLEDCWWKSAPCQVPFPCTKTATPKLTLLVICRTHWASEIVTSLWKLQRTHETNDCCYVQL